MYQCPNLPSADLGLVVHVFSWPRPRQLCVGWGPSCLVPKKGAPIFAHVGCGQTAGWIKMPVGMQVGLGPSDIVLDGDPAPPPQKGGRAPNFWLLSIIAKRLDGSRWNRYYNYCKCLYSVNLLNTVSTDAECRAVCQWHLMIYMCCWW